MKSQKIVLILIGTILLASCVSRLGRPALIGVITDFDGNPIENCSVGEVLTDKNGNFALSEMHYNQFLLSELFQMEAPPLIVVEPIIKKGYELKEIYAFNKYGGGATEGEKWHLDTIRIKKENQEYFKFIKNEWLMSANKELDTVYLIKSNFNDICKTRKCDSFYYTYSYYLDSFEKNNHPKEIIRKSISFNMASNNLIKIKKIIKYVEENGDYKPYKPNDTIRITGEYFLHDNNILDIKSDFYELNGSYKIIDSDYEYLKMKKLLPAK